MVHYRPSRGWTVSHMHGKKFVTKLKCIVCFMHQDKIKGQKNFSEKWITGAESLNTSNLNDHAQYDQHTYTRYGSVEELNV